MVTKSQYDKLVAERDSLLAQINTVVAQAGLGDIPAGLEMKSAHGSMQDLTNTAGPNNPFSDRGVPAISTGAPITDEQFKNPPIQEALDDLSRPETAASMKGGMLATIIGPDLAATTANILKMPATLARGIGEQIGGVVKSLSEGKAADAGYQASQALAGLVPGQYALKAVTAMLGDRSAQKELQGMEFMPALDALGTAGIFRSMGVGKPSVGEAFVESGEKATKPFQVTNVTTPKIHEPVFPDKAPFNVSEVKTPYTPQFPDRTNTLQKGKWVEPMFPEGGEPEFPAPVGNIKEVGRNMTDTFLHGTSKRNVPSLAGPVGTIHGKSKSGNVLLDAIAPPMQNEFKADLLLSEPEQAQQALMWSRGKDGALVTVKVKPGTKVLDLRSEVTRAPRIGFGGPEVLQFFERPAITDDLIQWVKSKVSDGYKQRHPDWESTITASLDPKSQGFQVDSWQDNLVPYARARGIGMIRFADETLVTDRSVITESRLSTQSEAGAAKRTYPGGKTGSLFTDTPITEKVDPYEPRFPFKVNQVQSTPQEARIANAKVANQNRMFPPGTEPTWPNDKPVTTEKSIPTPSLPGAKPAVIQKPSEVAVPKAAEAPTAPIAAAVAAPPKVSVPGPNEVSIRKANIERIFKKFKFDKLDEVQRKGFEQSVDEAMQKGLDKDALNIAESAAADGRALSDAESAGAVAYLDNLLTKIDESRKAGNEAAKAGNDSGVVQSMTTTMNLMEELHRLGVATDKAGTASGRGLAIRKLMSHADTFDEAHIMQIKRAAKGKALTKEEIAASGEQAKQYAELQKENERLVEIEDAKTIEAERLEAEQTLKVGEWRREIGEKAAKSKEKIIAEREAIKKAIRDLGYKVNDVVPASGEALYQVGRLAVNYIKEGAVSLDEVAKLVMADVPGLTKFDVYAALNSKNPKAKARAKTIAEQRVSNLKKQSRLLLEIEDVSNGITKPKTPRPAGEMPSEVSALQSKLRDLRTEAYRGALESKRAERAIHLINKLQDQLDNHYREVKAAKKSGAPSPKLESLNDRIAEIKKTMRSEDTLADLQEQLRTGEFKIEHRPTRKASPELERNQIEINRLRKQIRQEAEAMAPKSLTGKAVEGVLASRSLMASGDASATFRQAFWLSARRPGSAFRGQTKALQAMFSEFKYEKFQNEIRNSRNWHEYQKAKLELTDMDGPISGHEEYFRSRVTDKLPWVKGANRHMTTVMNFIRKDAFDQFLEAYPEATQQQKTAWADFVNVASGRGKMALTPAMAKGLNTLLFAPKFAVSRFQTPTRLFRNLKDPIVRNEILKDYTAVIGVGLTAMTLAKLAGADVGLDPRDPDFGKIRLGDTRVDIWAGVQQPARLVARTVLAGTDHYGITGRDLSAEYKKADPYDLLAQFASFKLSPAVTIPHDLWTGKDVTGQSTTPLEVAARALLPLMITSMYESSKNGLGPAIATGMGEAAGMGVNTFPDSERVTRAKLRALKLQEDWTKYNKMKLDWNRRNPKNRIEKIDIKK